MSLSGFGTQYAEEKAKKELPPPPKCSFGDCLGEPVFNGLCAFHAWAKGPYERGAVSRVLKRDPIYHTLLRAVRKCGHYSPPKTDDEWKVIWGCLRLLNRAKLVPKEIDLNDTDRLVRMITGEEIVMVGGFRFGAIWISRAMEHFLITKVHEEAERIIANTKRKEDLIDAYQQAEDAKAFHYREKDFQEFEQLNIFK